MLRSMLRLVKASAAQPISASVVAPRPSSLILARPLLTSCHAAQDEGCSTSEPVAMPFSLGGRGRPSYKALRTSSSLGRPQSTGPMATTARLGRLAMNRIGPEPCLDSLAISRVAPDANASSSLYNRRLRVAVDVDEVLGRFLYKLNLFCKEKYGMVHEVSDFWVYEYAKIWKCSPERSNEIVHDFLASQHFLEGIPVIPGAFDALERLSESCDLVVVTSRQHVIQDVTLDWIDMNFPGLFQEVYFGNHFAMKGTSRKKSEICSSIGAELLIDDNPTYAHDCASNGIHVLLYDWNSSYPWSKLPGELHPLITVVRDWEEVEREIGRLAPQLQQNAGLRMASQTVQP